MEVKGELFRHRLLLLKIGQRLSESDLEELLYLAEEVLSGGTRQKTTSALSLFRELQHRDCLSPHNYDFLRGCLLGIGRNDLVDMLPNEEDLAQTLSALSLKQCRSPTLDHKKLLLSISDQLRVEDVKKMAYLCSCEAKEGLELIQLLEKKGVVKSDNYNAICDALTAIGRSDLSKLLKPNTA